MNVLLLWRLFVFWASGGDKHARYLTSAVEFSTLEFSTLEFYFRREFRLCCVESFTLFPAVTRGFHCNLCGPAVVPHVEQTMLCFNGEV